MVIYRVKNVYTGEIKETNSFRRSMEIAVSDLKYYVWKVCHGCGVLLIEKVVYDCDESEWDGPYWEFPVLSESVFSAVYVSTMSVQIRRISDDNVCVIWRK